MDTITHTLFGLTIYKSINKEKMNRKMKRSLFFTSLIGSQIPDIDVVSRYFDSQGLYQMWHRGITHSIFLVPIWAALILMFTFLIWRVKDKKVLLIGLFSVFIHNTSDLFNAWGTGYLEPFSSIRITFGTISIIDFFVWLVILIGYLISKFKKFSAHKVFKIVLVIIATHFFIQSVQGYIIYQKYEETYDQHTLSASFIPWHYQIIGKKGQDVEISDVTLWSKPKIRYKLNSHEQANLDSLFENNPSAKTLYEWSPFVVIVDDDDMLGIYDPRFYRNGQSFLFEYIEKQN